MIDATLRGSLILVAALVALRFMRRRSAAERELVLRCAILAMLVLSAVAATMHASLLWITGAYVMLVRLVLSVRAVLQLESREVRRIGRVSIRVGDVPTPMTWGLVRPVVLLPESARRNEAIVRHELAHVRRGDATMLALAELTKVLQWFNPLVWLAVKRLRAESERACDDAVVASGLAPADVAERLVAAGVGRRVLALLDPRVRRTAPSPFAISTVVAIACVSVVVAVPRAPERDAALYDIEPRLAAAILDAARAEEVDADLAFALVKTESNFRANAVSPGGAIGLTQILPSTARQLDPAVSRDDLFAHCTNLRLGFRQLRREMNRFGHRDTALVAYNLGARRVAALRASHRPLPMQYAHRVLGSIE